jgi:hypothetical protein
MMTVLSLQQFQGQWIISAELLQLVGIVQEDVEKMDISKVGLKLKYLKLLQQSM